MKNKWSEKNAKEFVSKHGATAGNSVALLAYATRLVGSEPGLALHGGGNTSIKATVKTMAGGSAALFVKASGLALDSIGPSGFVCLDLAYVKKFRQLRSISDSGMANEFRTHLLQQSDATASVETLMHAFLDKPCIIHTHPAAVLALCNREGGEKTVSEALGKNVAVLPYADAGLALGRAVSDTVQKKKDARAVVVMHHGLITWGAGPKQAYDDTIELVSRAEAYLKKSRSRELPVVNDTPVETAWKRYAAVAPMLRGLLSPDSGDPDNPHDKISLAPLISEEVLGLLGANGAKELFCTAPLTPDYCVRTKSYPLWIDNPNFSDGNAFRRQCAEAVASFSEMYASRIKKYSSTKIQTASPGFDALPRVVFIPGLGAVCAAKNPKRAVAVADITEQALFVKRNIFETGGTYKALAESHLFEMEFRGFQVAKMKSGNAPLGGAAALVTGAAGAIGSGICEALLELGCSLMVTDLAGDRLDAMAKALKATHGNRVAHAPLDVTDSSSVASAFETAIKVFGGLDIVIVNAGLAHVSPLVEMDVEAFRRLERVNIDGTLNLLAEAGRLFRAQNTGGDIVLVSTKNVFAPGAKFGAYSATKAAAHQLGRIASLEFAEMGVRVNMVSPDAVFSHGATKSGLWQQVGPDRMKARGLDEKGLEEYYRQRNLLKAKVTARHVANAVLFFVTHQTPTTGATIPVDGGLPDATPR
ncbi:MAG TPA: bifunctional aldolase/short-chain dehydrogenase [Chitinivibrionales bacterium]|nr:bifunctional aldolase/short-chain dehydrogenase [Chitinivibrionales bacterium]